MLDKSFIVIVFLGFFYYIIHFVLFSIDFKSLKFIISDCNNFYQSKTKMKLLQSAL